jgi:hypothetical protein
VQEKAGGAERARVAHGDRGKQGKDGFGEFADKPVPLFQRQFADVLLDEKAVVRKGFREDVQEPILVFDHFPHAACYGFELLPRRHAGGIGPADLLRDEQLEAADADHAEFVQVGGGDGEELQAFEEGKAFVGRFVQHPLVEFEPTEFPVEERVVRFCLFIHDVLPGESRSCR